MPETNWPPEFAQRVLALEAPGAEPARVGLVAPTRVRVGEPLALKLTVYDAMGYPCVGFDGEVVLRDPRGELLGMVRFLRGDPSVCSFTGASLGEPGLYRFEAQLGGETYYSNPVSCSDEARPGVFWGDPHIHTALSNCHPERCRSLNYCYFGARYVAALDWAAAADHVSNGRCDFSKWKEQIAACNAHNDAPHFATLPAYEASFKGGRGGDNNYYMSRQPSMFVDGYEDGNVRSVCEKLREELRDDEFFAVPHHTTRTGKHGEISDEIFPGEELMPVMEIHSKWGTSEYRGNPNPLHKIHPGPSYAVDMLNRGLRLGFIGGTDTHSTMAAGYGDDHLDRLPGMTAVYADTLDRRAIFDGIRTRNCYAASGERIYLEGSVAGLGFGQSTRWADPARPRELSLLVAGKSDVIGIDVVRNGRTLHSSTPADWNAQLEFTDDEDLSAEALDSPYLGRFTYYYFRVTCASGAQAWSSPVWLKL
jgi:uncharacterized protein DUF3604